MRGTILLAVLLVLSFSIPVHITADIDEDDSTTIWGEEIRWIKMGLIVDVGNPGDSDDTCASAGHVIFDEGLYKIWYSAYNQPTATWSIMYATSPDGMTFTKQGIVLQVGAPGEMDDDFVRDSMVLRNDDSGLYEMFYTGQKNGVFGWRVFRATSTDGIIWQKLGVVFSGSGAVGHPYVIRNSSGSYRMWFSQYDSVNWRIRYATSIDGQTWTDEGLVLDIGSPGDPDSLHVYMPSVLIEPDGTHVMFYSTSNGNPFNIVDIHYATSPNGMAGSWTKIGLAITHGSPGDYDELQAIRPLITRRPNGLYELWYSSYDGVCRRLMLALGAVDVPIKLSASVENDTEVLLNWSSPNSPFIDHYLIFRAPDQRSFDFSSWLHNTSSDPNPLQRDWYDLGAARETSPAELYYTIRAVYTYGEVGTTSNTAGKWTMTFDKGMTSFSMPLEPFVDHNVSWYADQIPYLDYFSWMGSNDNWIVHRKTMGEGENDSLATFGHGYELSFASASFFTFCGLPGSMIRFKDGLGDDRNWARSLRATDDGTRVDIYWDPMPGSSEYVILESHRRDGVNELNSTPVATVPSSQTSWGFADPFLGQTGRYFMVVAVNSTGAWGSSTYSVGIERRVLKKGTNSIGVNLDPQEMKDIYQFCNENPAVVGVAYALSGVWKFHSSMMPSNAYNTWIEQGRGYQVSVEFSSVTVIEIGH
ncbi:MAG: hypothetical protein KAR39_08365 [Thermoplasmata archaeon]|nr:hypothetical protein [Thermoplasmata archaeon]